MRSEVPATDVAVYLQALYFRLQDGKFYIPMSLVIPGSQINAVTVKDKDKATIDILGQVRDAAEHRGRPGAADREPLAIDANQQLQKKNVQYSTGFDARARQVPRQVRRAREPVRQHGQLRDRHPGPGHEEDAAQAELRSSCPASARPTRSKKTIDPLVRDGQEWVPNVPHVFRQDQHLYFLYEVYNPTKDKGRNQTPAATQARCLA